MADSSTEPQGGGALLITDKQEVPSVSGDLAPTSIAMATEGQSHKLGELSGVGVGDSDSRNPPLPAAKAATTQEVTQTMMPEEMLSSENGTVSVATTEEESLSFLLSHMKSDTETDTETGVDQEMEETSSVDQGHSTDSASLSIPSLDLSDGNADGNAATGNSLDVDEALLPSCCPAVGAEGGSPSLRADEIIMGATPAAEGGATAAVAGAALETDPCMPAYYLVKWITWKEKKTPIVTQSQNGPCPLLAIMNTLFLRWKAKLPPQTEVVTTEDLMAHLGECVLSVTPREKAEGMELNFQQNMSDAMAVLPKLSTGLDVNVGFSGVSDFEYTPELIVFDLLDIALYHGWLLDPQSPEMVSAVGKLSYNQLVEKIIDCKHSTDSSRVSEGLVAEQFLESTATQLSYHGLCELNSSAREGEICVFFRNNHFSTVVKHQGHLYLLVTDQGFLNEERLVWESLHNVEGDGNFCDSEFRLCHPPQRVPDVKTTPQQQQRQIDQDYLVAMSLQQTQEVTAGPLSDLELARQLQEEEYQQQQQQQQQQQGPQPNTPQVRGQASGQQAQAGTRRREKDSDCVLL